MSALAPLLLDKRTSPTSAV